jgi:hypothetical protein
MKRKGIKTKGRNGIESSKAMREPKTISYRMKCAKTANGLSHFVMYGDIGEKEALL